MSGSRADACAPPARSHASSLPLLRSGFDPATGVVKLRMAGSCVGCPSSTATLRNGVENMLMHYIPEVKSIEQVKTELETSADDEVKVLEAKLRTAGLD